jgi:hypothetical protein
LRIVLWTIGADEVLSTRSTMFISWLERNFWGMRTQGRTLLASDSGLSWKLEGRSKPVMHYSAYTRVELGWTHLNSGSPNLDNSTTKFKWYLMPIASPAMVPEMLVDAP